MPNSNATQRMAVVPYDKYEKLSQAMNKGSDVEVKTSSNEEKLMSLDEQMKRILEDSSLNDVEKLHKYSEIMTKYLDYKDKVAYESEDKKIPRSKPDTSAPYRNSEDVLLQSESTESDKVSDKVSDTSGEKVQKLNGNTDKVTAGKSNKKGFRDNVQLADIISNWIPL